MDKEFDKAEEKKENTNDNTKKGSWRIKDELCDTIKGDMKDKTEANV